MCLSVRAKILAAKTRKRAHALLQALVSSELDVYEGYKQLYGLWVSRNAAVQDLRPLFRIPGVDANGIFSVDDYFRNEVITIAEKLIPLLQVEELPLQRLTPRGRI
jgi:hypothetical protein